MDLLNDKPSHDINATMRVFDHIGFSTNDVVLHNFYPKSNLDL